MLVFHVQKAPTNHDLAQVQISLDNYGAVIFRSYS